MPTPEVDMFILLLVIAGASAVYSQPMPRPHLVMADIAQPASAQADFSPRGLAWQQVVAPYTQQPPVASGWGRK